jgi:hypothetical protein
MRQSVKLMVWGTVLSTAGLLVTVVGAIIFAWVFFGAAEKPGDPDELIGSLVLPMLVALLGLPPALLGTVLFTIGLARAGRDKHTPDPAPPSE